MTLTVASAIFSNVVEIQQGFLQIAINTDKAFVTTLPPYQRQHGLWLTLEERGYENTL